MNKTELELGRFRFFLNRKNATNLQRLLVSWLIAKHGLSFKFTEISVVQQMITAVIDSQCWFGAISCAEEAKNLPLAWTDLVTKAKTAARKILLFSFMIIPFS